MPHMLCIKREYESGSRATASDWPWKPRPRWIFPDFLERQCDLREHIAQYVVWESIVVLLCGSGLASRSYTVRHPVSNKSKAEQIRNAYSKFLPLVAREKWGEDHLAQGLYLRKICYACSWHRDQSVCIATPKTWLLQPRKVTHYDIPCSCDAGIFDILNMLNNQFYRINGRFAWDEDNCA